jgi:Flp pilus assembly protein TadG
MTTRVRHRFGPRDAGAVSILFAVGLTVIMAIMALSVDFGGRLRAAARAQALAEQAARAGAQQINNDAITGVPATIDLAAATKAACTTYLNGTGASCPLLGPDAAPPALSTDKKSITVTVQITYQPTLLELFIPDRIDLKKFVVTGTATATLIADH